MNQDQIVTAVAKPARLWPAYLTAAFFGAVAAILAELPWQLVLYCAFFAPGVWRCMLILSTRKWLMASFAIGLFLIVAGMVLSLIGMTL
jgi:vacuolar-type H+-ATPase subunit I/STV1